jgi:hypothetical protein
MLVKIGKKNALSGVRAESPSASHGGERQQITS